MCLYLFHSFSRGVAGYRLRLVPALFFWPDRDPASTPLVVFTHLRWVTPPSLIQFQRFVSNPLVIGNHQKNETVRRSLGVSDHRLGWSQVRRLQAIQGPFDPG